MPDETASDQTTSAATTAEPDQPRTVGVFSGAGIGSAVLGVVALVAVVLASMIWVGYRSDFNERAYRTTVLQAAADWTNILINMNSGTVAQSMQKLQEGTVGELNANFEASVKPFSQVVQKLQSQTVGQVESAAIETVYHAQPGDAGVTPPPPPELSAVASRTDTVIVVATSKTQNAGAQPLTVNWALRLGVSDVDGTLLVSSLEKV